MTCFNYGYNKEEGWIECGDYWWREGYRRYLDDLAGRIMGSGSSNVALISIRIRGNECDIVKAFNSFRKEMNVA